MIEVVSSSSQSLGSDSVEETANNALQAIVAHYQDPIHDVAEMSPYFDAAPDSQPHVPAVLQHWLGKLEAATAKSLDSDSVCAGVSSCLIQGYTEHVRPTVFRHESALSLSTTLSRRGIPVLQNYELFMSQILQQNICFKQVENSEESELAVMQGNVNPRAGTEMRLSWSLEVMASDLSFLTKMAVHLKDKDEEDSSNTVPLCVVTNVIIPIMIRLITHQIDLLRRLHWHDRSFFDKALRKCAVVMLAFGLPKLDPRNVIPHVTNSMTTLHKDLSFLYVPMLHTSNKSQQNNDEANNNMLDIGSHHLSEETFWKIIQLDGTSWEDVEAGTVSRTVDKFWSHLYRQRHHLIATKQSPPQLTTLLSEQDYPFEKEDTPEILRFQPKCGNTSSREAVQSCLEHLSSGDAACMAKAVRAHFFGRDVASAENRVTGASAPGKTTTRLHLGWEIEVQEEDPAKSLEKPFLEIPSRVHAAVRFLLLLKQSDLLQAKNKSGGNAILEEMLPVVYELLSASASAHIAVGAAALIHLLSLSIVTAPSEKSRNANSTGLSCDFVFAQYTGSLLPVLEMACNTCREGAPFFFLARAQSLLCLLASASQREEDSLAKHRRQTTHKFLSILDRHSHKVSDPSGLLWALLMGGVLPLFYQHAKVWDACQNVDGMEMGRTGLMALLPIVRYSAGWSIANDDTDIIDLENTGKSSRKLLGPSVVALVHLLHAAYPIMPRHGGKIMSELLSLLGNLQRQKLLPSELPLMELVKDATAVALVICGDRASKVLDLVTANDGKDFEPGLVQMADIIRERAEEWEKAQQEQPNLVGNSQKLVSNERLD